MEFCLCFPSTGSNKGTMVSLAPPTWHSALEPAPPEFVGVSRAWNSCSRGTQQRQAQRKPEEGLRNYTEAKSRASCQEEQGSSQLRAH